MSRTVRLVSLVPSLEFVRPLAPIRPIDVFRARPGSSSKVDISIVATCDFSGACHSFWSLAREATKETSVSWIGGKGTSVTMLLCGHQCKCSALQLFEGKVNPLQPSDMVRWATIVGLLMG
jgi:hypothetical protein